MKKYRIYLYLILICVLLLQFISFPIGGTHIKPYMLICILIFFLLFVADKFYIYKLSFFEGAWLFTYFLSILSISYASNYNLAIQLVLGQCILVLFFFTFRLLLIKNTDKDEILYKVFSAFIYLSVLFYIIGCVQVFVFNNTSIFYQSLNEQSYRVWGCYFEGDNFPRLMGLSESPNNYVYFASTILWWSVWKKKATLAYITLVTLILTISTTGIIVLAIQGIIYVLFKGKISLKFFIGLIFLTYVGYTIYLNNEFIQSIVEVRTVRNTTGSGRFEIWSTTMKYIEERPILGYGCNQFREIFKGSGLASAHNNYIETLLSTGIVGLIFYITFILSFFSFTVRLSRKYENPFFILMSTAFIVFGFANNTLTIEYVPFILALTYSYGQKGPTSIINH